MKIQSKYFEHLKFEFFKTMGGKTAPNRIYFRGAGFWHSKIVCWEQSNFL